jgi:hypothetical protein
MCGVDRQYGAFGVTLTVLTTRQKPTDLEDELEELEREGWIDEDMISL